MMTTGAGLGVSPFLLVGAAEGLVVEGVAVGRDVVARDVVEDDAAGRVVGRVGRVVGRVGRVVGDGGRAVVVTVVTDRR